MTKVRNKYEHPVLIFDADCGFCTRCVNFLKRLPHGADIQAFQFADLEGFGTTEDRAQREVLWVDETGGFREARRPLRAFSSIRADSTHSPDGSCAWRRSGGSRPACTG